MASSYSETEKQARGTLKTLDVSSATKRKSVKRGNKKKKGRGFLHDIFVSIFWLINIFLVAVPYLLALLAQYISPRYLSFPAILALGYPLLLLLVVVFLLVSLFRRRWYGVIFNFLLLLLSWGSIQRYMPIRFSSEVLPPRAIKVLSLNCQAFSFLPHLKDKPNPTLYYIKQSGADVVCLQEALEVDMANTKYVNREVIARYLSEYKYKVTRYAQGDRGSSLMILSKFPISNTRLVPIDSKTNGAINCTLDIGGKQLSLYNVHLQSFSFTNKEEEYYSHIIADDEPIKVAERVSKRLLPSIVQRAKQAERLYLETIKDSSPYILICGDFNDTPISYTHHKIASGLQDAYATSGLGVGFSYKLSARLSNQKKKDLGSLLLGLIAFRIDHIIHSKQIHSYRCSVDGKAGISDHAPIMCYISLD